MDVLEAIKSRRSVRKYTEEPVTEEQVTQILEAGRWTATKGNKQPWKFIVLKDAQIRNDLANTLSSGKFLSQAPLGIAIVVKPEDPVHAVQDGAAATQNMLLAAHALGLGACWITAYDMPFEADAKRILGIPDVERLLSVISVGHPAETPQKEKKALEEITFINRYDLRS